MTDSSPLMERLQAALGDAYRIEREIGGGGMSRLFLATEASLNRRVVIKLLPPEFSSEVSAARFRQEIEVAAHLQHPNILPLLNAGARDGLLYYVMPFVPGESLRHRLTREGKLPVADAIRLLHEMADALAHAHAEGVIHRDIKPENILLEGRHAVLTDFGVARALLEARTGGRLTETGLAVGTPGYMSPEQAAGERNVDARADVYALAVVGYEMLTGAPPFTGPTAQAVLAAHMTTTPRPVADVRAETPRQVSDAIARALAKDPGIRLRTAAELRDALGGFHDAATGQPGARRWLAAAIGAAALLAVAAGWLLLRPKPDADLDPDLIAVAPFDVLGQGLELWREGMVDVLARNLDGAGALRTVAPSTVIRGWSGRADPPSAAALGRKTGAGLAVFGQMVASGTDSVQVRATIYDVASDRSLGEVEIRAAAAAMDRVADSLTVGLLGQLGRSRPVGAVRATALRATSLPALKAFLKGEQFYRRTVFDSALTAYRETVVLDSGFAPAWRRMSSVYGWTVIAGDSLSEVYSMRAASLNRGWSPRESLLIAADSLTNALYTATKDTSFRAHRARLFATLELAKDRYSDDPEVWYSLGDAHYHFAPPGRSSPIETLQLFDRAIALDSAYGESYIHAVWLAMQLDEPTRARQYIEATGRHLGLTLSESYDVLSRILAEPPPTPEQFDSLVAKLDTRRLVSLIFATGGWADSSETAVRVARRLESADHAGIPLFDSPLFQRSTLSSALAFRGRLREAYGVGGDSMAPVGDMGLLGGVPQDVARRYHVRLLEEMPLDESPNPLPNGFNTQLFAALPWWAARRDTASIERFAAKLKDAGNGAGADTQPWLAYGAASATAYLSLARGDTARATDQFAALPDTICFCPFDRIAGAQLLLAAGRDREAVEIFDGQITGWQFPAEPLWRLTRGRAHERTGQRDKAIADYSFTAAAWRNADSVLQPYVTEAKAGIARLTGEPTP